MNIRQLGYLGLRASDLQKWRSFAEDFLGMHVEDQAGRLLLRMDERCQRFILEPDDGDGLAYVGLEVDDAKALGAAKQDLNSLGFSLNALSQEELKLRHVADGFWLKDPEGHHVELYWGAAETTEPLACSRRTGGFRTGALGLGHVVFQTPLYEEMDRFYREVLGLRLSDYMDEGPIHATFLHMNPRHHSIAFARGSSSRLHHIMVEYAYLDDVGRLYDMALSDETVAVTLGRHSNDHMFSFYARSPGGFLVEAGWAGRLIDMESWTPYALYGPSIWGHERSWLPPEGKQLAKEQLKSAADQGIVEPTEVVESPGFNLGRVSPSKQRR